MRMPPLRSFFLKPISGALHSALGFSILQTIDALLFIDEKLSIITLKINKRKLEYIKRDFIKAGEVYIAQKNFTPRRVYNFSEAKPHSTWKEIKTGDALIIISLSENSISGYTDCFDLIVVINGEKLALTTSFPSMLKMLKKIMPKDIEHLLKAELS
jgi:hypothetical protein